MMTTTEGDDIENWNLAEPRVSPLVATTSFPPVAAIARGGVRVRHRNV